MSKTQQNGQTESPKKSGGLFDTLSNVVGSDGVKIDTRVVVGNDIYYKMGATIIITMVICLILYTIYRQLNKA